MKLVYHLQWEHADIARLAPKHPDVEFVDARKPEDAVRELADADIFLVAGPYYKGEVAVAVNTAAPKLKWVQSSSIGTDKFEEGGFPDNVQFTTSAGLKGRTVAEHTMALLLGYVHAVHLMERARASREWARDALRNDVSCIEGLNVLLLGYGSIGVEIARKAKAFDAHVVALNRTGIGEGAANVVEPIANLKARLPEADFVICCLPATADTEHLIDADAFALMKESAVVLNVGRGSTIEHAALLDALRNERIRGAALDVYEQEPLPLDDPLWDAPNLILSPHVAGTGGPVGRHFAELVSENITRLTEGGPLRNLTTVPKH